MEELESNNVQDAINELSKQKQSKEINVNLKLNKTIAIIASILLISLLLLSGSFILGQKSKDGQIEACQAALEAVGDVLNDYEVDSGDVSDNLEKCDKDYR